MSAPGQSTWDIVPPYRPGEGDFNDFALEDDGDDPPGDPTLPSAALFNTAHPLLASVCAVIPNLVLGINGGNPPTFGQFTSMVTAVRENPAGSTFTLNRTGAGIVVITCPANTFPAAVAPATACLNSDLTSGGAGPYSIGVTPTTNGWVVVTKVNGTSTDLSFTLTVY
jgi:hypothetical protein